MARTPVRFLGCCQSVEHRTVGAVAEIDLAATLPCEWDSGAEGAVRYLESSRSDRR